MGSAPKRRTHSKVRTGCLTCRKRRIKCDEKKPICDYCEKGPRECTYPSLPEQKEEAIKRTARTAISHNLTTSELVNFSSSATKTPPFTLREELSDPIQIDQKWVIESLAPPSPLIEPLVTPPALIYSGLTPATYTQTLQSRHESLSITESMLCIPQPISPHGTRSPPVQFFLQYHQEVITEAHYLQWYDYSKFCTEIIFTLAETTNTLRHAMVAFSALIYSIKENNKARAMAFLYYSAALQDLRLLLDKPLMDMTDCFVAVATALQLSSFDRFFGDVAKCHRHLEGAARIMQQVTNAAQFCSSVTGRSLLAWYLQFENYCCLVAACELLLPRTWRDENVRIRQKLAIVEYPHLSDNRLKARMLDDIWAEFWMIVPQLIDVVSKLPKLKNLADGVRTALAIDLRMKLAQYEEILDQFINFPHVQEVLEPAKISSSHPSKHTDCCPTPPFIPYELQFPPSGIFRIVVFGMRCYIQSVFRPVIHEACGDDPGSLKMDSTYSIEVCKTFAGIEDALGDNPDACLPLFTALILAISTCPQELRRWFWYKLAHFEELGLATFRNPIREYYAKLWNITDIRSEIKGVSALLSPRDEPEYITEP